MDADAQEDTHDAKSDDESDDDDDDDEDNDTAVDDWPVEYAHPMAQPLQQLQQMQQPHSAPCAAKSEWIWLQLSQAVAILLLSILVCFAIQWAMSPVATPATPALQLHQEQMLELSSRVSELTLELQQLKAENAANRLIKESVYDYNSVGDFFAGVGQSVADVGHSLHAWGKHAAQIVGDVRDRMLISAEHTHAEDHATRIGRLSEHEEQRQARLIAKYFKRDADF